MRSATFSMIGTLMVPVLGIAVWPQETRLGGRDRSIAQGNYEFLRLPDSNHSPFAETVRQKVRNLNRTSRSATAVAPATSSPGNQSTNNAYVRIRDRDQKIESALDSLVDLDYQEVQWRTIRSDIADKFGVPIHVLPSARELLPDDLLISLQFKRVSLRMALELYLEEFGITYVVKNGMLLVSESSQCPLVVRTFDCSRLLQLLPDQPQGGAFGGGGDVDSGGVDPGSQPGAKGAAFAVQGELPQIETGSLTSTLIPPSRLVVTEPGIDRHARAAQIIELIHLMVYPDGWCNQSEGTIKFAGNVLVVRETGPMLFQIGKLLDDLQHSLELVQDR